jgi:hypothetical protein
MNMTGVGSLWKFADVIFEDDISFVNRDSAAFFRWKPQSPDSMIGDKLVAHDFDGALHDGGRQATATCTPRRT